MLGTKEVGRRVLILENEAYFMGTAIAQKLAGEGQVTMLTQMPDFANYMEYTLEAPMLHRDLHRLKVRMHPYTMVEKIEPGRVSAHNIWDESHKEQFEIDSVVLCTQRISDDEIYRELRADPAALEREGIEQLHVIGDAAAPRMLVDCIFDGHRLAREIDSENPAIPLPFIRERRLWGGTTNRDFEEQLQNGRDIEAMPDELEPAVAAATSARGGRRGTGHRRVKIVVAVKQVAKLDDEFELRADGSGSRPTSSTTSSTSGTASPWRRRSRSARVDGDGEVVVVSVGDEESEEGTCLAMGADRGVRVWDPSLEGADALAVARVLAAAAEREHPDRALRRPVERRGLAQPASRWPLISGGHTWLS